MELDPAAVDYLGVAYYLAGDLDPAVDCMKEALVLVKDDLYAIAWLAILNYLKKQFAESMEYAMLWFKMIDFPNLDEI